MSTEKKNGNVVELKPEEVPAQEAETAVEESEKTVFGKIDDKIVSKRKAKAEKKEAKAKAKEQKAAEGKKFDWKKALCIGAGVVGTVGTVLAVLEHNQAANQTVNGTDQAPSETAVKEIPAPQEPVKAEVKQSEPVIQETVNPETK